MFLLLKTVVLYRRGDSSSIRQHDRYVQSVQHPVLLCLCCPSFTSIQNCIATHECNGIDIIIALILNDINPLGKKRMDLVLELKVSDHWFITVVFHIHTLDMSGKMPEIWHLTSTRVEMNHWVAELLYESLPSLEKKNHNAVQVMIVIISRTPARWGEDAVFFLRSSSHNRKSLNTEILETTLTSNRKASLTDVGVEIFTAGFHLYLIWNVDHQLNKKTFVFVFAEQCLQAAPCNHGESPWQRERWENTVQHEA